MSEFIVCLEQTTNVEWEEISQNHVRWKLEYSLHRQLCVVTPNGFHDNDHSTKMYVPTNGKHLHDPHWFYNEYLHPAIKNAKAARRFAVENSPWVKFVLEGDPAFERKKVIKTPKGTMIVTYSMGFSGDIKLRPMASDSELTLSSHLTNVSINAKTVANNFLETFKANFDVSNHTVSVGNSLHTELSTSSIKLEGNSIELENTPSIGVTEFDFHNWQIELQCAFKIKATFKIIPDSHESETVHLLKEAAAVTGTGIASAAGSVAAYHGFRILIVYGKEFLSRVLPYAEDAAVAGAAVIGA